MRSSCNMVIIIKTFIEAKGERIYRTQFQTMINTVELFSKSAIKVLKLKTRS